MCGRCKICKGIEKLGRGALAADECVKSSDFTQILHNIYFPVVVYPARIHYNRRRYSVNKIREWMCNTG